jgi:hypothetical protein
MREQFVHSMLEYNRYAVEPPFRKSTTIPALIRIASKAKIEFVCNHQILNCLLPKTLLLAFVESRRISSQNWEAERHSCEAKEAVSAMEGES